MKGRHLAFDEDPTDAFTTRIEGGALTRGVNAFLGLHDSPPFDSWQDLIENRDDLDRREAGLKWFETSAFDFEPHERNVIHFEQQGYHAYAPHAVYTILTAEPIEDGYLFERTTLPDMNGDKPATGLFFTTSEQAGEYFVELQTPPDLAYANSVIALDGTPFIHPDTDRVAEWEVALGRYLDYRQVLDDEERAEYLRQQGYVFVQTSPYIRPYSSGRHNDPLRDATVLEGVRETYGESDPPLVFTSKKVEEKYRAAGFIEKGLAKDFDHPGNLRGTDEYGDERLLVQLGSSHHGDHELRRRAARLGEAVPEPEGKGVDRDYGEVGNAILRQMRENQVAQNALRVGRDGKRALVVLDTCAFPEWIPVEDDVGDVSPWSTGERQVRDAWHEFSPRQRCDGIPTETVADADGVEIGKRQVNRVLEILETKGHLTRRQDPDDRRRTLWIENGLGDLDPEQCAEIDLPDIDIDSIETGEGDETSSSHRWEVDDISRIELYTRNVVNFEDRGGETNRRPVTVDTDLGHFAADGGDPPPDTPG